MEKKKGTVIITGGNGQLATSIKYILSLRHLDFLFEYDYVFTDVNEIDITNKENIEEFISKYDNVKYIVNCAAYTNVEKAQEEGKELCFKINSEGVYTLGKVCKEHDIFLITIGSDYMYETPYNLQPIIEERYICNANFVSLENVYGCSKAEGYLKLCSLYPANEYEKHFLFINTSWLYSEFGNNFVKTIYNALKKGEEKNIVMDQIGSPTYAPNLAHFIVDFIERDVKPVLNTCGIINVCGLGTASWYDIAKEIEFHLGLQLENKVKPILTKEIIQKAIRPKYSVLSTQKLINKYGDEYTDYWRNDLRKCLKKIDTFNNYN